MKLWHSVIGLVIDPDSGLAWVLTIFLLVFTVRLILLKPMWRQMWSMRRMQQLQPKIAELQQKHKGDREKLALAIRELQKDEQVSFAAGCLPFFIQIPVFFGLYHVLTQFSRNGISIDEASTMGNGAFGPSEVSSFLHATLFGVPLSAYISMPSEALAGLDAELTRIDVFTTAFPLLLIAGMALFINMRRSMKRSAAQQQGAPTSPFAQSMQDSMKIMAWILPLFPIIGGLFLPFFPLAICLYWAVNNLWTMVQVEVLTKKLDAMIPLTPLVATDGTVIIDAEVEESTDGNSRALPAEVVDTDGIEKTENAIDEADAQAATDLAAEDAEYTEGPARDVEDSSAGWDHESLSQNTLEEGDSDDDHSKEKDQ